MYSNARAWATCVALLGAGEVGAAPRDMPAPSEAIAVQDADPAVWMKRLTGRFGLEGSIHHVLYVEVDGVTRRYDDAFPPPPGGDDTLREWSQPIAQGKADCIAFADGPGLQCVVYVDWPIGQVGELLASARSGLSYVAPSTKFFNPPSAATDGMGASSLRPGMVLAGLMPGTGAIRLLLVDDKGLAHPQTLELHGDSGIAKPPCVNQPGMLTCEQVLRIEARPDARIMYVTFGIRTVFPKYILNAKRNPVRSEELVEISLALRREAQSSEAPQSTPPVP